MPVVRGFISVFFIRHHVEIAIMLEHLVLFKFKADADVQAITIAFLAMKEKIPVIHEISFGPSRTCLFVCVVFNMF